MDNIDQDYADKYHVMDGTRFGHAQIADVLAWCEVMYPDCRVHVHKANTAEYGIYVELRNETGALFGYVTRTGESV